MISLNDVLLAMSNIPVDDPIAEIWGRGLQGGHEIVEYTGTLPITITADGNALIDYRIYGNTVQTGTPTPENPVDVVGCGIRTGNLWDEKYIGITIDVPKYCPVYVGNGTYTLSTTTKRYGGFANVFLIPGNVAAGASTDNSGVWEGHPRRTNSIDGYITIAYRSCDFEECDPRYNTTMLNSGSTALPYEPYGYKLPMTVSDGNTVQNVPVYIGENKLTEAEYVSYGEQKIYRDVDGTLTPTDPPVPFPEIPTIDGTTIIDYDGTPKPSQMYIKYRR